MLKGVKIDAVQLKDYGSLAAFLADQKAGDLSQEEWQQRFPAFWEHNPFFKEDFHPRGWLLRDEAGRVGGFVGNIPMSYSKFGQDEICYTSTTWFVSPQFQSCGLLLYARFLRQKAILINTSPTPKVELILKEFKFNPLQANWIEKDFFFPINLNALAQFLLIRLNKPAGFKLFTLIGALGIKLLASGKSIGSKKLGFSFEIKEIQQLPSDTNQWWEEFKSQHSFTLVRNEQGLRYFFLSDDYRANRKLLEIRQKSKLIGFCGIRKVIRQNYSYLEVLDIATLSDHEELYQALINQLKQIAQREGCDIAFIKTNAYSQSMEHVLTKKGFLNITGHGRFYFRDPEAKLESKDIYGSLLDGDRVCL